MVLPKHVTEMSNCVEDLENQPRCQQKKVEQMLVSFNYSSAWRCQTLNIAQIAQNCFSISFPGKFWKGSEIILCAGFCLLLSLSLPFTWNNELQPLAILKFNHCDGILGAMSILQIHKKCTPSGGCLPATESVFGHIGGNRAQLGCSLQKVLQKHNF